MSKRRVCDKCGTLCLDKINPSCYEMYMNKVDKDGLPLEGPFGAHVDLCAACAKAIFQYIEDKQ